MEVQSVLTGQVTQLLYCAAPNLNFAHIVGELYEILLLNCPVTHVLTWDCDDIALLDFDAARVVIGFSENMPGPHAACVTVAVGQSPLADSTLLVNADQIALGQQITDVINQHYLCDAQRTCATDQPLTADLVDAVVETLYQPQNPMSDQGKPLVRTGGSQEVAPEKINDEPGEMERLMRRLSTELVTRTPSIITRAIASAVPKTRKVADPGHRQIASAESGETAVDLTQVSKAAKSSASFLWGKAKAGQAAARKAEALGTAVATRPASSAELRAVRAALYADDFAQSRGVTRISAKTKLAYHALTDLSHGFVKAVSNRRRGDDPPAKDPVKH